ncbi:hypothetical protein SCHPADRAFT_833710 [Schizopora paradoxa]|uniref:Zn(2)-C6 fungal-type domain-containing protein n=1 Tax=Schizopora paradoxa TaxID=27342 RepID=A0A0H2RJQ0_9AGAM|nr:hypothetical protein SCHPADRAFT_833710 [Schizopora paradoxa]
MPVHRDAASNDLREASSTAGSSDLRRIRERETELKRQRGEISCAECRRLKLKCDKRVPCFQCTRRGCEGICPNGTTSSSGVFVLADTDKLHQKLAEMSRRIRQLEDALQVEYGSRSTEAHPLLSDELLSVKGGIDQRSRGHASEPEGRFSETKADPSEESYTEALGLLTISEGGAVRFLGTTDGEFSDEQDLDSVNAALLPAQIAQTSQMWPFTPLYAPKEDLRQMIESQLPTWERASALTEAYLQNLSWFFRPVDRQQIVEELLPTVFKRRRPNLSQSSFSDSPDIDGDLDEPVDLHDLALLLMVFACGAAGDLTLPPFNREAETYRQLARATLGLKNIFDGASLSAVQAVCFLGMFDVISGRKNTLETSWKMLCLGFSLSASVPKDRDPARWGLSKKLIERRRRVFWDVYTIDHFKSLGSGRPTTFSPDAIDCEFPEDTEAITTADGTLVPSGKFNIFQIWRWKHRYAKEILTVVTARLCAAQPLKYSEILDLDRKVREFDFHPWLHDKSPPPAEVDSNAMMQRLCIAMFKEVVLLYIHRNFFARALLDSPTNPLRSPFAPSFLAAYRSATQLLKVLRENFDAFSYLFIRLWPIWAHALAASVIVGSVVSRGPSTTLAPSAFIELEMAIALFTKAAMHPVAKQGLVCRITSTLLRHL